MEVTILKEIQEKLKERKKELELELNKVSSQGETGREANFQISARTKMTMRKKFQTFLTSFLWSRNYPRTWRTSIRR